MYTYIRPHIHIATKLCNIKFYHTIVAQSFTHRLFRSGISINEYDTVTPWTFDHSTEEDALREHKDDLGSIGNYPHHSHL